MEAEMPPKQMSYGQFSREVGRWLANCFDQQPAPNPDTKDSKSALERGIAEAFSGLEKESDSEAPEGSPVSSDLGGRPEALHKLSR
jgi:hypothetical protein